MRFVKALIIIVLLSAFSVAKGQTDNSLLDKIDFNDTTLIEGDLMWATIAEYITQAQQSNANPKNQSYNMIMAADNVLSRCVSSYQMYVAVYQYLLSGFSQLGNNMLVDYLVRMPYLEHLNADDEQINYIISIAESYQRVKIGTKAPEIQSITVYNQDFDLYNLDNKQTVILFWSYSCLHCRDLIRELGELASSNADVNIVTVNVSGDLRQVKKLLKKSGLKNQYNICDGKGWDSPIVDAYAVDMTPSLFLLDENKIIVAKPFDIDEVINSIGL